MVELHPHHRSRESGPDLGAALCRAVQSRTLVLLERRITPATSSLSSRTKVPGGHKPTTRTMALPIASECSPLSWMIERTESVALRPARDLRGLIIAP